jgi:hypothetical protein
MLGVLEAHALKGKKKPSEKVKWCIYALRRWIRIRRYLYKGHVAAY